MSDGSFCANCKHYLEHHNVTKEGGNAIVTFCRMCDCGQYVNKPENPVLIDAMEAFLKERAEFNENLH